MDVINQFRKAALQNNKRIVFPEGEESRIIHAASFLKEENLVTPILIGNPDTIQTIAKSEKLNLAGIEIVSLTESNLIQPWSEQFFEMRKHKNITHEQATQSVLNPLFYAAFMLRENLADGAVAGSINTTGNVLRAAIQVVGLAEGVNIVSSSFIMVLKTGQIFTFADCAVIPDPDEEQLASIALSSAHTHERLIGDKAKVAMLSFSTKGSAEHPHAQKVIDATAILKKTNPQLEVDGELQFDAAYLSDIGTKKAPNSSVAGQANVYIFPDLDAGNIGYKITQRLAGAEAIGPVIQGLNRPYNDLSRGCSVEDVINVACICSLLS
jgi:phosphate acetyltransferase